MDYYAFKQKTFCFCRYPPLSFLSLLIKGFAFNFKGFAQDPKAGLKDKER